MAVDTKPIEDAGRIGVARKYIVLKLPIAGQLKQSIEKDAPRKRYVKDLKYIYGSKIEMSYATGVISVFTYK